MTRPTARLALAAVAALTLAACSDPLGPSARAPKRAPVADVAPATAHGPSLATAGDYELLSTTWVYTGQDPISFYSSNSKARAVGAVNWYEGAGLSDYKRRADYTSGTKVYAAQAVGCIWAKVSFGYPTGSISVGAGVGGSISGGTREGNYYVSCRTSSTTLPAPLQLGGVGYVHSWLNSTTVEICTSTTKAQGPLYCAWQKRYFL